MVVTRHNAGSSHLSLTLVQLKKGLADRMADNKKTEFLLRQSLFKRPPAAGCQPENEVVAVQRYLDERFCDVAMQPEYHFNLGVMPSPAAITFNEPVFLRHDYSSGANLEKVASAFKAGTPQEIARKVKQELLERNVKATVGIDVSSGVPRIHIIHREITLSPHQSALLDQIARQKNDILQFEKKIGKMTKACK